MKIEDVPDLWGDVMAKPDHVNKIAIVSEPCQTINLQLPEGVEVVVDDDGMLNITLPEIRACPECGKLFRPREQGYGGRCRTHLAKLGIDLDVIDGLKLEGLDENRKRIVTDEPSEGDAMMEFFKS